MILGSAKTRYPPSSEPWTIIMIFNMAAASHPGCLLKKKNSCINSKKKRENKPVKAPSSSSSMGLGFDEDSDEGYAMLRKRKSVKRLKVSPPASSTEDGSGEYGKGVSHIALERNRRKQMNEHLAMLRHLMPSFYVKKGDQASIIGGVIDYINELHQVFRSLGSKKQRKVYSNEVGQSPRIMTTSPRLAPPHQQLNLSPLSTRTPRSTTPYKPLIRQPFVQPSSITSPTSNSSPSCCSVADMIMMMNNYNNICKNNAIANELLASSKSSVADVNVKFSGLNLELKALFIKCAGQTVKIVSAIEDLALDILKVSINSVEETMLNVFTIKIGLECQLSAEELVQHIQQTFC